MPRNPLLVGVRIAIASVLLGPVACLPQQPPVPCASTTANTITTMNAPPDPPYAFALPAALPRTTTPLEAESGVTTGTLSAVSTALHTPGAEASGRRFVSLSPGQRITWQAPVSADSVVVRFSYPDSADGHGRDGALELHVAGQPAAALPITSRYSWGYGKPNWGSTDVWSSDPSRGSPRHFWDEASLRLPSSFAVNTAVTLVNPANSGQTVLIDFLELETVPPPEPMPAGSLSFADFKPAADGATDDTQKLEQALAEAAAQQRVLYVPEGSYRIASVEMHEGVLQGAGMWHTRFIGPSAQIRFTGGQVAVTAFAIFGETTKRNDKSDEGNAFAGRPGDGSRIERIWVEHMKCAFWVARASEERGPTRLRITGCRFRNLMADAVNFCNGTTDSMVDNTEIRNSGDDALAAWSPVHGGPAGGHNTFAHNRIQSPWVASGIALYGGGPFRVLGNTVEDTVTTGSGIYVSANFGAHPFSGLIDIADNVLVRCGAHESDSGDPTGAIRVLASDQDMTQAEFRFRRNTVLAPLESAVSLHGPHRISGVRFEELATQDAPLTADVRPGAQGEAVFIRVTSAPGKPVFRNADAGRFTLKQ
jgi:hypothetical protein